MILYCVHLFDPGNVTKVGKIVIYISMKEKNGRSGAQNIKPRSPSSSSSSYEHIYSTIKKWNILKEKWWHIFVRRPYINSSISSQGAIQSKSNAMQNKRKEMKWDLFFSLALLYIQGQNNLSLFPSLFFLLCLRQEPRTSSILMHYNGFESFQVLFQLQEKTT